MDFLLALFNESVRDINDSFRLRDLIPSSRWNKYIDYYQPTNHAQLKVSIQIISRKGPWNLV